MRPTENAILARFNGDKTKAFYYCERIAVAYPHLAAEYTSLAFRFGFSNPNVWKTVSFDLEELRFAAHAL